MKNGRTAWCACFSFAAGLGIEPKFSLSESDVLPLDDPAMFLFCRHSFYPVPAIIPLRKTEREQYRLKYLKKGDYSSTVYKAPRSRSESGV